MNEALAERVWHTLWHVSEGISRNALSDITQPHVLMKQNLQRSLKAARQFPPPASSAVSSLGFFPGRPELPEHSIAWPCARNCAYAPTGTDTRTLTHTRTVHHAYARRGRHRTKHTQQRTCSVHSLGRPSLGRRRGPCWSPYTRPTWLQRATHRMPCCVSG